MARYPTQRGVRFDRLCVFAMGFVTIAVVVFMTTYASNSSSEWERNANGGLSGNRSTSGWGGAKEYIKSVTDPLLDLVAEEDAPELDEVDEDGTRRKVRKRLHKDGQGVISPTTTNVIIRAPKVGLDDEEGQQGRIAAATTSLYHSIVLTVDGASRLIMYPKNAGYLRDALQEGKFPISDVFEKSLDYVRAGGVVIQGGASFAYYTMFYAHRAGPEGLVVAIEPQTAMYQLGVTNLVLNDVSNVKLVHAALGFRNGSAYMSGTLPEGSHQHAVGRTFEEQVKQGLEVNYAGWQVGSGGEEVPMVTIDAYDLVDVALIKLSLEGFEQAALYGARDTIRRCKPAIIYKQGRKRITQEIKEALDIPTEVLEFDIEQFTKDLGYTAHDTRVGEHLFLIPPNEPVIPGDSVLGPLEPGDLLR